MDIFVSPTAAVLARFVCFVAGSVLAVLIVLTVWDEDVLNVEHILTIMTVLGGKSTTLATYSLGLIRVALLIYPPLTEIYFHGGFDFPHGHSSITQSHKGENSK